MISSLNIAQIAKPTNFDQVNTTPLAKHCSNHKTNFSQVNTTLLTKFI